MKKLKPAGWLALVILTVLVIGGSALLFQEYEARTQTLADLPTVPLPDWTATPTPTPTPTPPPTPDPTLLAHEATPEGWTIERDLFTGDNYMAPPPDVETAVRDAFEAVFDLMVIEDRPNEQAIEYSLEAALERINELAAPEIAEYYSVLDIVMLGTVSPENPVRCQDYDVCQVTQAKLGPSGAIVYNAEVCSQLSSGQSADQVYIPGDGSRCVTRHVIDEYPYMIYTGTVELQEDGVWRLTDWQADETAVPSSGGN